MWKFQTGVTLRAKDVYDVVNGTCVKPEPGIPMTHVSTCDCAEEIWKKLLTVFERRSELSVHLLQQNLQFLQGECMS
ncbi:hypothetical protein PR048_010460 [Dryococelus australis]|uniref:Uncharacterized protein n=1 Tax=Dryococelus australis TaxID=614101 RepID=A0ABQ9I2U3_9NEOP|nr:hypothetical protein PR048_010460 [Dryococelus australis]